MFRGKIVPGSVAALAFLILLSSCMTASDYRDPDALARLTSRQDAAYILVDVRTPAEYASGHIPTAANIPVAVISSQQPSEKKDALIIVYCASGGRSASAARQLASLGYTNVVDFGSISRWKGALVTGGR